MVAWLIVDFDSWHLSPILEVSNLSHRPETTTTTLRKEEVSLAVGFAIKEGGAPCALEDGEEISLAAAAAAALPLISPEDESSSSSSAKCSSERH